jgi:hypothetical protein
MLMEIPGAIFVIVGLLVAGFSIYFNISQGSIKMTFFIVLGAAMIAWGVIKGKLV